VSHARHGGGWTCTNNSQMRQKNWYRQTAKWRVAQRSGASRCLTWPMRLIECCQSVRPPASASPPSWPQTNRECTLKSFGANFQSELVQPLGRRCRYTETLICIIYWACTNTGTVSCGVGWWPQPSTSSKKEEPPTDNQVHLQERKSGAQRGHPSCITQCSTILNDVFSSYHQHSRIRCV
jgi:hypothetical protein